MFADLKEYQDLTRIYNESVNISEEERQLEKFIEEEDFTLEELEFCVENFEEICSLEFNEDYLIESNLNEEELHEVLGVIGRKLGKFFGKKAAVTVGKGDVVGKLAKTASKVTKGKSVAAIKKAGKTTLKKVSGIKTGASNLLTKAGTKIKNVVDKVKSSKIGKKLIGAGKGMIDAVKKNPAKILVPGAVLGAGVAGFMAGGKKKGTQAGGTAGAAAGAAGAKKLADAELDKKIKDGIASTGMGDKGTAMTMKGIKQASYNRGERAARKKLNDPTLNLTKSELEAKKKETPTVDAKPKKPMSKLEFQNRKRFGDKHVDNLKAKNVDFKKMRKGEMSKQDFIDKYPKSQTAKKYNNSDKAYRDYKKSLKKEDYSFAEAYANMYSTPEQETINEGIGSLIGAGLKKLGSKLGSKAAQKAAVSAGGIGVGVGGGKLMHDSMKEGGKKGKKKPSQPISKGPRYHTGHPIKIIDGKPTKMMPNNMPPSYYGGQKNKDEYQSKLDKLPNPKPPTAEQKKKADEFFKKKKSMKEEMDYLGYDAYDVVLEYLLQTEQVSSIEEANYVMTEMEGTTINEILNEMVPLLGGIMKAGKTIGKAMKKGAGAMAVGAGVGAAGAGIGKKIKQGGKKAGEAMKGAAKAGAGGAVGGQASRKMRGE